MNLTPPAGSTISVTTEGSDPVITIPAGSGGMMRFFAAAFILVWLGGWTAGFAAAGYKAMEKPDPFLLLWLGAWTIGGVMAGAFLYRLLRPSVPETLRLGINALAYDSGIPPLRYSSYGYSVRAYGGGRRDAWGSLFPKRAIVTIDRRQMQTLRLRDTDSDNRLTVDAGADRLDLARNAGEVEREWLYRVLAEKYGVSPEPGDG